MTFRWLAAFLVTTLPLHAQDFTTDFSSATQVGSGSTAVYNLVRRKIHVPFVVDRNCDSGALCTTPGTENETIDIGTGADGAFDATTASRFDTNSGSIANTITLDTSRDYHFTTFALPAGVTLRASGTRPLMLHVQGDMRVDGIINVSGGNGGAPNNATTPRGGTACCGGKTGGDGGDAFTMSGVIGTAFDTGVLSAGGGGAAHGAAAGGGGGGGSVAAPGTAGGAGSVTGGAFGLQFTNPSFTIYGFANATGIQVPNIAGSGGGGGGQSATMFGGAGGAGGGAVLIQVGGNLFVSNTGYIYANGGNGGGAVNSGEGCGGGGGGGAAMLLVAGTLGNNNTNGITADGGAGGTGCGGGNGGNGGKGILRLVSKNGEVDPAFPGSESPPPTTPFLGTSLYSLQPVVYLSTVVDTGLTNPSLNEEPSTSETLNGGTVTYQFAGSNDNFVADDTGWVNKSDFRRLNGKRYFKYRITLQATSRTASPEVSQVLVRYSVPAFDYRLAGCARIQPRGPSAGPWWALFFLTFVLLLPRALRRWA